MVFQEGALVEAQDAWVIHRFLMNHSGLLTNRFLFFEQNVNGSHWNSSAMCNPWLYVLQDIKTLLKTDCIPEILEPLEFSDFIHGWLFFDPMSGFITKWAMTETKKINWDCYVWLLNMAASYQSAAYEKTLVNLDYGMHLHLQKKSMKF